MWTSWDLGIRDATAIWFAQVIGREIRIIDYYEASGVDLGHYVREINARPYVYAGHIVPHDAQAKELGTGKSRLEVMESLGLKHITLAPLHRVEDGINAVRMFLPNCWFDEKKCARGIDALKLYRADYDTALQALRPQPGARLDLARGGLVSLSRHDARPPDGAERVSPPDRICAAGSGVTGQKLPAFRPAPLHAPERRLRHRPVDHGGLLWCRERGRNPVFESGHLRCRVAKIANGSAAHAASVRKAMSPAKTYAAGKAVRRSDHTGQRQHRCKNRFHDRVPRTVRRLTGVDLIIPRRGCLVGLASIGAVLWSSGRLMP